MAEIAEIRDTCRCPHIRQVGDAKTAIALCGKTDRVCLVGVGQECQVYNNYLKEEQKLRWFFS